MFVYAFENVEPDWLEAHPAVSFDADLKKQKIYRSWCNWHASSVDSKPKNKKILLTRTSSGADHPRLLDGRNMSRSCAHRDWHGTVRSVLVSLECSEAGPGTRALRLHQLTKRHRHWDTDTQMHTSPINPHHTPHTSNSTLSNAQTHEHPYSPFPTRWDSKWSRPRME